METRIAMHVALKVRATKPTVAEGDLALAAWRRCLYAFLDQGIMHPDDRRTFLILVGEET